MTSSCFATIRESSVQPLPYHGAFFRMSPVRRWIRTPVDWAVAPVREGLGMGIAVQLPTGWSPGNIPWISSHSRKRLGPL